MATNEQDAYQKTRSNRMCNLFLADRICQIKWQVSTTFLNICNAKKVHHSVN